MGGELGSGGREWIRKRIRYVPGVRVSFAFVPPPTPTPLTPLFHFPLFAYTIMKRSEANSGWKVEESGRSEANTTRTHGTNCEWNVWEVVRVNENNEPTTVKRWNEPYCWCIRSLHGPVTQSTSGGSLTLLLYRYKVRSVWPPERRNNTRYEVTGQDSSPPTPTVNSLFFL